MKKILKICVLPLFGTFAMAGCGKECGTYGYGTELGSLRAELHENDVAVNHSDPINTADLRLKIFCEITSDYHHYVEPENRSKNLKGCSPDGNLGLYPSLGEMTLTCGGDIAGIPAGTDLLSAIKPSVTYGGMYEWPIDEWRRILNQGRSSNYTDAVRIDPGITYEFEIVFLPHYVAVEPGSYEFTFLLRTGYGENDVYVRTFDPVTLVRE